MKSLLVAIREAFSKIPPHPFDDLQPPLGNDITPAEKAERDKRIVHHVVKDRSSSNVFLQRGKYVTREELDERRERILAYKWADE